MGGERRKRDVFDARRGGARADEERQAGSVIWRIIYLQKGHRETHTLESSARISMSGETLVGEA